MDVPSSFKNIGEEAFEAMTELKEVRFKGNVESFRYRVFSYDTSLQSIYLDHCNSVPSVIDDTFDGLGKDQKITVYVKDEEMQKAFAAAAGWQNHGFTFEVAK